jgi:hypothetical protein
MPEPRPARWNHVSLFMPFVGFVGGYLVGAGGTGILWDGHPMEGILYGFLTWGGFCFLGLVAASIAWARAERLWGITLAGFILNGILPTILLCMGISELNTWWRYG